MNTIPDQHRSPLTLNALVLTLLQALDFVEQNHIDDDLYAVEVWHESGCSMNRPGCDAMDCACNPRVVVLGGAGEILDIANIPVIQ